MELSFRFVREDRPGEAWAGLFRRTWPSYRKWFLREGDDARPDLDTCRAKLTEHMPELVAPWERLCELAGGDEMAARMLSLYRPTPYLAGCSQAVWSRGEPMLVRNYDYHPDACEGTVLRSAWNGTPVLAATDCLWGVLDGMNGHGLVVALSFGGRRIVGNGFGIPLVLRYMLELCRDVDEAAEVLVRVPSHMSYNISLLDARGERRVVHVAPDRPTSVNRSDVSTNHQREVEWQRYDALTRSADRERHLIERLGDPDLDEEGLLSMFLRPPLFSNRYRRGFGTLYTAAYCPARRSSTFLWHGARVTQSIDDFTESTQLVQYEPRDES